MMVPFFWMIVTSLKTRAEVFGAAPLSLPTGAHWENYERMWNGLPGVTFGTFFLNSLKLAAAQHGGPGGDLLDGRLRVRGDPVPGPAGRCSASCWRR